MITVVHIIAFYQYFFHTKCFFHNLNVNNLLFILCHYILCWITINLYMQEHNLCCIRLISSNFVSKVCNFYTLFSFHTDKTLKFYFILFIQIIDCLCAIFIYYEEKQKHFVNYYFVCPRIS